MLIERCVLIKPEYKKFLIHVNFIYSINRIVGNKSNRLFGGFYLAKALVPLKVIGIYSRLAISRHKAIKPFNFSLCLKLIDSKTYFDFI
nr:uncharacterized protein SPCC188.05 [Schizosaccharomyces pombe]A6X994.1 RecName: Full=Putative uncharacterized protein SPCC188.05 [Schizosaccharomyces pombe 972h-]pir/T41185/ hypothetical protein SPCC188.05 - fission yeast (Schizosaccharomyces pombe) [Schizosaccharomyces pombe]CAO77690.1 dubious [Schizosaccharomyces pombe]|eukprot:NP_001343058.1 uncharacterized protein SPCC188.05 [Schizosaccharomyces pombe]